MIDLDALAAEIEARRSRRRQLGIGLWCEATEARVLAAMIAEPGVLECCDDVEYDDFANLGHRLFFRALRSVQSVGSCVSAESIMAYLEANEYQAVGWANLGLLVASTANYGAHDTVQLARDLTWLRTLAKRRSAA